MIRTVDNKRKKTKEKEKKRKTNFSIRICTTKNVFDTEVAKLVTSGACRFINKMFLFYFSRETSTFYWHYYSKGRWIDALMTIYNRPDFYLQDSVNHARSTIFEFSVSLQAAVCNYSLFTIVEEIPSKAAKRS